MSTGTTLNEFEFLTSRNRYHFNEARFDEEDPLIMKQSTKYKKVYQLPIKFLWCEKKETEQKFLFVRQTSVMFSNKQIFLLTKRKKKTSGQEKENEAKSFTFFGCSTGILLKGKTSCWQTSEIGMKAMIVNESNDT